MSYSPIKISASKGVSLIELLLVIAAVAFLALLIANLPSSIGLINKSRHSSLAKDIISREVENLRKVGYLNLSLGSSNFTDSDLSQLSGAVATYQVDSCPVDICKNSENIRIVKIKISWQEPNAIRSEEVDTLIGEGGLGYQ